MLLNSLVFSVLQWCWVTCINKQGTQISSAFQTDLVRPVKLLNLHSTGVQIPLLYQASKVIIQAILLDNKHNEQYLDFSKYKMNKHACNEETAMLTGEEKKKHRALSY